MRPVHVQIAHLGVGPIRQNDAVSGRDDNLIRIDQIIVVVVVTDIHKIDEHRVLIDFVINIS